MAVMLTQWSPVPWSGETVPRPALPPPAEPAAPTPIYERLVREWSLAGRTVPRHGRHRRHGPPGSGESAENAERGGRADQPRPPYEGGETYAGGSESYGRGDSHPGSDAYGRHGSVPASVAVSGYGDGRTEGDAEGRRDTPPVQSAPRSSAAAREPSRADTSAKQPAWERVRVL